jgi:hypothetical protein
MGSRSHNAGDYSEVTSFEPVALDDLENPLVRQAVAYWRSLCGVRRFPARDALEPRALVPFQSHMILLKVVDDGADFEYRFVGAAQAAAYTFPVQGRRMKEMMTLSPDFGPPVFAGYRYLQQCGTPFALRGWAGKDYIAANFAYTESVTLPLGARDDHVDHLVIFSAYVPRGFKPVST